MRPLLPVVFLVLFPGGWNGLAAQTRIYGTTMLGGASGVGVLYSMNTDGSNYQVLHSFQNVPDGAEPTGKMVPGPGGKLYGFTPLGGALGHGIIYSWDTAAGSYQKLMDLDSVHAAAPGGDPLFFDGELYGIGQAGGVNSNGTIFSYDLLSGTLTDVYDFSLPAGAGPFGSITVWNNIFFFETSYGAAFGNGSIMSFDPAAGVATDLFDFGVNSNTGTINANLLLYNNMLYGSTAGGGGSRLGCIFSLDPRTGAVRDLWNFLNYYWGQYPEQLAAYNGKLYGTALIGGVSGSAGTLFSLDLTTLTFSKLYDWQADAEPTVDGANPVGPVVIDSTGMLWGATSADGPNNAGVIYNYNLNTNTYNILFGFNWTPTGGGARAGFILQ
jgi:uncharacterized repeat protein (TIGR03803 family)